jgi:flavorubredoxin
VYARQVDDQTLTFAVSGLLWNRSLVMVDEETSSLWSHLLGEAMDGPLKGKVLRSIPSTMTDWTTWKSRHPESTVAVMGRTMNHYRRRMHHQGAELLIGLTSDQESRAWPFVFCESSPSSTTT